MTPAGVAEFDSWLRSPLAPSPDPRFIVRRAHPAEYDSIYDLVDEVLEVPRPRAVYDWWYRQNPHGAARCWTVFERISGQLISASVRWPWQMASRNAPLSGCLSGDQVVRREWQRQGVNAIRRAVTNSDAWMHGLVRLSWPNHRSRAARRKYELSEVSGCLRHAAFWLDAQAALRLGGWTASVISAGGRAANAVLRVQSRWALRGHTAISVEAVRRFDATYDDLGTRCPGTAHYWCPHDAAFLNWRYIDHPVRQYTAFAAVGAADPLGYGVLSLGGDSAMLMELVAPQHSPGIARALLARALAIAREAGCKRVECIAPLRWPHWQLVHRAGFVDRASEIFALILGGREPGIADLDNWSVSAGEIDTL